MQPPCSKWNVWLGKEIEGTTEVGKETLFIRHLSESAAKLEPEKMTFKGRVKRVWFCKEFVNWTLLRKIAQYFDSVCVEATPKTYENIPKDIREKYQIYLKVSIPLKKGDHVCVGIAFQDEAFQIGTGATVNPEAYLNDTKIL